MKKSGYCAVFMGLVFILTFYVILAGCEAGRGGMFDDISHKKYEPPQGQEVSNIENIGGSAVSEGMKLQDFSSSIFEPVPMQDEKYKVRMERYKLTYEKKKYLEWRE